MDFWLGSQKGSLVSSKSYGSFHHCSLVKFLQVKGNLGGIVQRHTQNYLYSSSWISGLLFPGIPLLVICSLHCLTQQLFDQRCYVTELLRGEGGSKCATFVILTPYFAVLGLLGVQTEIAKFKLCKNEGTETNRWRLKCQNRWRLKCQFYK